MDSSMEGNALSPGQQQALDELYEIADTDPNALEILDVGEATAAGWLRVLVSLGTAGITTEGVAADTGPQAQVRARERFAILVPPDFPFDYPRVSVPHNRFAGLPHVQWQQDLCLYISPTTEWQPADGMFGFIDRLLLWVSRAATGTLDPAGEPLHPPVAYATAAAGAIVVRANASPVSDSAWQGFALLRQVADTRVDLIGWVHETELRRILDEQPGDNGILGLAILLPQPTAYEFPRYARTLLDVLHGQGMMRDEVLGRFAMLAFLNRHLLSLADKEHAAAKPTYVIVGTPMRGIAAGERRYHLAAWRLSELGQDIVALLDHVFSDVQELAGIAARASGLLARWLDSAELSWAKVYEDRPEVTTRRDHGSPLEVVRGRHVLLLGCGAIGGHAAEHLVRAGVSRLVLVDRARVSPGVLLRQPYDDLDVHRPKAEALAERLRRIRPDLDLQVVVGDAMAMVFRDDTILSEVDFIIDAAANPAVVALLERRRHEASYPMPPIISLLLGHTACRGIVIVAPQGYSGAGVDLLRKVKLATLQEAGLRAFADDFFPDPPRTDHFQPEPGCSEATFMGSDAEVAALTATMLLNALMLCVPSAELKAGGAILVDLGLDGGATPMTRRLNWPADVVLNDANDKLEVRLAPAVVTEMRAECRLMTRRRGPQVETGGILLGEIDEACGVAWVSMASGPPPDSRASTYAFVCGTEGVEELIHERDRASRGALRFLGIWHSHPSSRAAPSIIDNVGMRELMLPVEHAPRRALMLIVGGSSDRWESWMHAKIVDDHAILPHIFARISHRTIGTVQGYSPQASSRYAEALVNAGQSETRRWPRAIPRIAARRRRWYRLRQVWRGRT